MSLFLLLVSLLAGPPHPIHVSVSDVILREESVEWTARIYKDDLLLGLYGKRSQHVRQDDVDRIRQDILRYMQQHVSVMVGDAEVQWTLAGLHPDPEAMWITLTAKLNGLPLKNLSVHTTILMEVYDDQKNIVNLEAPQQKNKTFIFESGDTSKKITF